MKSIKKFIEKNKCYIILFLVIFLISLLFPYTAEDWKWGSIKINNFTNLINAIRYKGRFLGNFLAILLTHNKIIRGIIIGLTCIILTKSIKNQTQCKIKYIWLLILFIPEEVLSSGIIWSTGFAYFFIPLVLFIIIIKLNNQKNDSKSRYILIFILNFLAALFIENITLFLLVYNILYLIINSIKNKKLNICLLFAFLGSLIGSIIIFSINNYFEIIITNFHLKTIIKNYINYGYKYIAFNNIEIIAILILFIYLYAKNNNKLNTKNSSLFLYELFYIIYSIIFNLKKGWNPLLSYTEIFNAIITGIFLIILLFQLLTLFKESKSKKNINQIIFAIIDIYIPLIVLTLTNYGNFIIIYILECILTLYIYKETKVEECKILNIIIMVTIIIYISYFTSIYAYISLVESRRDKYIAEVNNNIKDEYQINIPELPYKNFIWHPDFDNETLSLYKKKNQISDNLKFKKIDYYKWREEIIHLNEYNTTNGNLKGQFINIPTYENSGEVTHPCVIYSKEKISGYHYWMAYTPWPNNNNKYENASIAVSNDGIHFITPKGLVNPVSGEPSDENSYYSDPYLFYDNDHFELWYRYNPFNYNGTKSYTENNIIYRKTSQDGINWSNAEKILDKEENQAYMSISVIKENNNYKIWYVNYDNQLYYRESSDLKKWSTPLLIQIENYNRSLWHTEVKKVNNKYELLVLHGENGGKLFHATSADGKNFKNLKEIDTSYLPRIDKNRIYKSSFIYEDDKIKMYIPYNRWKDTSNWQLYLKEFNKNLE